MKILAAVAFLWVSAAVALAAPATWQKENATQRDFSNDMGACAFQARAIFQPRRDAINARMNQPTQMAGAVAIRNSPVNAAAFVMELNSVNDQERQAVGECMNGKGWELK